MQDQNGGSMDFWDFVEQGRYRLDVWILAGVGRSWQGLLIRFSGIGWVPHGPKHFLGKKEIDLNDIKSWVHLGHLVHFRYLFIKYPLREV